MLHVRGDSTNRLFHGRISASIARGAPPISAHEPTSDRSAEGALYLLFRGTQRPDARAVHNAARNAGLAITHEFARSGEDAISGVELLADGLTFDLTGLAPSESEPVPPIRHRFSVADDIAIGACEAIILKPGPHIAAGGHTLPVVRALAATAARLSSGLEGLLGIGWPPARSLTGTEFFRSIVETWMNGGVFPALGFTAFAPADDGTLRSEGLAWFTGQELALDPGVATDTAAAARLARRLVNQLVGREPLKTSEPIVGPEGERLLLEPSDGIIAVRRG